MIYSTLCSRAPVYYETRHLFFMKSWCVIARYNIGPNMPDDLDPLNSTLLSYVSCAWL